MPLETTGTLLVITPISGEDGLVLPPYSARNLTQTLTPVGGASGSDAFGSLIRESVNGELINMFPAQFRKYQSVIGCTELHTPCLNDAYIGQIVTVECCAELSYPVGGTAQRPVVSGSDREENHFIFYRPSLVMMVTGITNSFEEWRITGLGYTWSINLREVANPNP